MYIDAYVAPRQYYGGARFFVRMSVGWSSQRSNFASPKV